MEKNITLHIDKQLSGRKIEYVLEKHLCFSRSLIARLKRVDGGIRLNKKSERTITKVNEGDILEVKISEKYTDGIISVKMELDILFEDDNIIAVNKPPAMPVHPSKRHTSNTLVNGLKYYLGENAGVHIITRLDRDTSGVVLVAKNTYAAKLLTDEMKGGGIQKEYVAIVNGAPKPKKGKINAHIQKEEGRSIKRVVSPDGKEALSLYEVLESGNNISLVKLNPITGRTHQLRVHMTHIGHPIYGDSMYGAPQTGERTRLHCHSISFIHPFTRNEVILTAPIPDDMCQSEFFGE